MNNLKNPKRSNTRTFGRLYVRQPEYALRARRIKDTQSQPEVINGYKVNRLIRWYEKTGNTLVGETLLWKEFSLKELQQLLDEPTDSPMFFCYELTTNQVEYFQRKLKQDFDIKAYEYFLECDAI